MKNNINFYTCCNNKYCDFIPLFVFSNLYNNKNSFVEVGYQGIDSKIINNYESVLKDIFGYRFLLKEIDMEYVTVKNHELNIEKKFKTIPNTVRFIVPPEIITDYVYISDIDIITLDENILDIHIKNMNDNNLKYSNIVRQSTNPESLKRLSGLHFTPYENYYPIPNHFDLCESGYLNHDEAFLYEIIKKRYPEFNYDLTFRPVHGIHVSPNREPTGEMNWGMNRWGKEWEIFRKTNEFLEVEKHLSEYVKDKIKTIDNYYK